MPLSGTVVEVNEALADAPEAVNEDHGEGWMIKAELDNPEDVQSLLDAAIKPLLVPKYVWTIFALSVGAMVVFLVIPFYLPLTEWVLM